ncbi:glycerophosphodiester phosphodiesterase family protein [Symbioplanes lichenis]|uniref:glycerophosphodiester phosphodiesterase family protein n=1 Tax=Symbioplanes lichenis TaxID=1629072 RepID=UPI002739134D|nr:glycerophosphodiester phosphodiesterase family protein [Actinoplanes lichenis]
MASRRFTAALATAAVVLATVAATPAAAAVPGKEFDLQAHRGGLALRPENTLASFGNALRLGVSTLELDVQITQDGAAVVTHDRKVDARKCGTAYAGRFVKDLTLAQVRSMDCGAQLAGFPAQVAVPGARMPLLSEVFDLIHTYAATGVKLNVETKVEAGAPQETAPREQFVRVVAAEVRKAGLLRQVTIQSFDWGALKLMRRVEPRLPVVALTNRDFLQTGQPGASPWLGGLDIDDFGGDPIAAIRSFGADAFSPVYGWPRATGGYDPYVTKAMVRRAHRAGIEVIPWTVDDPAVMRDMIGLGVDGLITDCPDVLRGVLASLKKELPKAYPSPFDIQAHRGGRATRPENTLAAFRNALANRDVSTLEMDTGVTKDGVLVVTHDRTIDPGHCIDTGSAVYVGRLIHDLTLAQLKTIDCGTRTGLPGQVPVPGERIPTLDEVFAAVRASGRTDIRLNIETKLSPLTPADTAGYATFTSKLTRAITAAGFERRATIQSFDWRTIRRARTIAPRIATVALIWQYGPEECKSLADECSLAAVWGDPSVKSPWTGGLDWWKFRDVGKLVRAAGASTVSANWQVHDPAQPVAPDPDWYLRQSPDYYFGPPVPVLQRRDHLKVVPYTVDDEHILQRVIDLGMDGVITDDQDLAVLVARRNGLR